MKRKTILLQIVVVIIGIGVLAFMLFEPHIEGRNVNATLFQIYFNDPFLIYAYTASIAFFVAIYKTFKLLGYIGQNKAFSMDSVKALQAIRGCAITIIVFILGAEVYLSIFQRTKDDIAGGVFIGLCIILISGVISIATSVFEKILQDGIEIETERNIMQ